MNACTTTAAPMTAATRLPERPGAFGWGKRACEWLARLGKAAHDRDALAQMSERELRDIGLDRGLIDYAVSGAWQRDAPR